MNIPSAKRNYTLVFKRTILLIQSILYLLIYFIFHFLTCSNIDGLSGKQKSQKNKDTLFLIIAANRATGNCLRKDFSTSKAYCDRRSSGLCNASDLILTSSEKLYNINEGKDLVNRTPGCNYSFLSSGISSDLTTSISSEDTIKANNNYSVVESCESIGIASTSVLVSESELVFVSSARGRIGVAADTIYNTPDAVLTASLGSLSAAQQAKSDALICLDAVFSQPEKNLFISLRNGTKTKSLSCDMNGGVSPCPF